MDDVTSRLPGSLKVERKGQIEVLRLSRPHKRNALNDETVAGLERYFREIGPDVKAVVLAGEGGNFSAGLDLTEIADRGLEEGIAHSRLWHRAFEAIEFGKVPVVAILHGAVLGGGLELAAACHIRIAETSTFYGLPEGSRGIFLGGGGSVRLPRLMGTARMMDMILTGRTCSAEEGQALGVSTYLVAPGEGLAKGVELARIIAGNASLTNFAVMHVLPRIAESDPASGFVTEALIASIAQADGEAKKRLEDFLHKRGPKVKRG
jgi:(methylthio)acryloyl-CoA hydratase